MAVTIEASRPSLTSPGDAAAGAPVHGMSLLSLAALQLLLVVVGASAKSMTGSPTVHTRVTRWSVLAIAVLFTFYTLDNTQYLVAGEFITGLRFFQFFVAGGICAFATHAACTPIDVVKTRLQTNPGSYNGTMHALRTIVAEEGTAALFRGLAATASGYFMHGAFKYSFYELFKMILADTPEIAMKKPPLHVAATAGFLAECVACIPLTPMEAIRIRSVADPAFAGGVRDGILYIYKTEGVYGLFKGLPSMLLKQVPYTVGQFVAFEFALVLVKFVAELAMGSMNEISASGAAAISLCSGLIAGVVAGVISQPGDTILSKINQGDSDASPVHQIVVTAKALGFAGLFLGLGARLVQVSCMIGGQFMIYDSVKILCGIQPASKVPAAVANAVTKKLL